MTIPTITHKRGDTFILSGTSKYDGVAVDLTGYVVTSQIRQTDSTLVDDLTCTVTNAASGAYEIEATATQTALWPIATLYFDVQFTSPDGVVISTDTVAVKVAKDYTLP